MYRFFSCPQQYIIILCIEEVAGASKGYNNASSARKGTVSGSGKNY
jgi:hypothetical protein